MTGNQHLTAVLTKYQARDISLYKNQIDALAASLKEWAGSCFVDVSYSGSYAKGTAVSLASDVDIFVSLSSDCEQNNGGLSTIYNSLGRWLQSKGYAGIRQQNVSYRVMLGDLKVDITPARKRAGNTNAHSLFVSKKSSWVLSSPQNHINDISRSGRSNEIKLLKIWRELHGLEFPSIYLEYLTILNLLYGKPTSVDNLEINFFHMLSRLAADTSNPLSAQIKDPANSNNILSDLLSDREKLAIKRVAQSSIGQPTWDKIVS